MTAKKDLKRRVRERQAQTGESYVTARRHVIAQAPDAAEASDASEATSAARPSAGAIEVDETIDLTAHGAALGFHCRVHSTSKLGALVDHDALLRRIRSILDATSEDPDMKHFRAVVLRGERPIIPARRRDWLDETRRFVNRAMAGIGGLSEAGNMLAFTHGSTVVLANIGIRRMTPIMSDELPRLVLSALVEDGYSASLLYVR